MLLGRARQRGPLCSSCTPGQDSVWEVVVEGARKCARDAGIAGFKCSKVLYALLFYSHSRTECVLVWKVFTAHTLYALTVYPSIVSYRMCSRIECVPQHTRHTRHIRHIRHVRFVAEPLMEHILPKEHTKNTCALSCRKKSSCASDVDACFSAAATYIHMNVFTYVVYT